MNIQECIPSKARRVFKIRPYKNFAIGIGVFSVICIPLVMLSLNVWVASSISLVLAICVYYYFESRVIFIECPLCRKDIDTNTPWECGFKQCRNENVDDFPFIHECEHCHFVPKAYVCHHCGEPIFLTSDRQQIHAAKCLVAPEPVKVRTVVVIKDPTKDRALQRKEQITESLHERDLAKIELDKARAKKGIEIVNNTSSTPPVVKSPVEMIVAEFDAYADQGMTEFQAETKCKERAEIELANNPHMLAQRRALIEEAARIRALRRM